MQLIGLNVNINPENTSIHNINFKITKSGDYYFYILLNEMLVKNNPIRLSISKGNSEL